MGAIDNILNTARANERVAENLMRNPFGVRMNLPIPAGPAGFIQRLRQGQMPFKIPAAPQSAKFQLPLRPSVMAQTPPSVKVVSV